MCNYAVEHASGGELQKCPKSIKDFISVITPVFNASALHRFQMNLESFDDIAGIECTEAFIQECPHQQWLKYLVERLFQDVSVSTLLAKYTQNASNRKMLEAQHGQSSAISNFDGTDEGPPGPSMTQSSSFNQAIKQVDLQGPTILSAWAAHPETRRLSMWTAGQKENQNDPSNLSKAWTPETPSANYVYHGTANHYNEPLWADCFVDKPFKALEASHRPNQMAPQSIGVVYTAFSPLRAYLWAAFKNHIYRMSPNAADLVHMKQSWVCKGNSYRGIILFEFSSVQPHPGFLTHFTISKGSETRWHQLTELSRGGGVLRDKAWQHYKSVHSQTGQVWPDIVHGLESGQQKESLEPFRTNLWRTIWQEGNGVNELNSRHSNTFAITFAKPKAMAGSSSNKEPSSQQKKKDDGGDGEGGGGGNGRGTLRKTLGGLKAKASNLSLRGMFSKN